MDFAGVGNRFDIGAWAEPAEPEGELARLQTQILPYFQGLDYRLPEPSRAYHRYEMAFDPGLQTAELSVDGIKRVSGYRGHNQFQEDWGFIFGAAIYKGDRASASFQLVRFEINP